MLDVIREDDVRFRSLTESMDATTPGDVMVFNVFVELVQFERDLIRERANAGLDAARRRGCKGPSPPAQRGRTP